MENLEKLVNDPEAMEIIASKESSMWAFMYSLDAFAALINSEIAMEKVAASETAVNVIIQAITDVANTEAVLTGIKEHLASVGGSLPGIPDGALKNQEVAETRQRIDSCVASLKKVTSRADVLIKSINTLLNNAEKMQILLSNEAVFVSLLSNPDVVNAIYATDERKKAFLMAIKNSTVKGYVNARARDYKTADGSSYGYNGKIIALGIYKSGIYADYTTTNQSSLYTSYCIDANGNLKFPCNPLEVAYAIFSNVQPTRISVKGSTGYGSCELSGYRAVRLPLEK